MYVQRQEKNVEVSLGMRQRGGTRTGGQLAPQAQEHVEEMGPLYQQVSLVVTSILILPRCARQGFAHHLTQATPAFVRGSLTNSNPSATQQDCSRNETKSSREAETSLSESHKVGAGRREDLLGSCRGGLVTDLTVDGLDELNAVVFLPRNEAERIVAKNNRPSAHSAPGQATTAPGND
jgi:hypothetical protein